MKTLKWPGSQSPRDLRMAVLAHDFRGPLTTLSALIQLFPEKKGDARFMKSFQPMMFQQINRLIGMTETLLEAEQTRGGRTKLVDFSELVKHATGLLEVLFATKKVRLQVKTIPGLFLRGNREQLESLVWNLSQNALESVTHQGKVEVSTRRVTRLGHAGDWLELKVKDNGPGIPKAYLRKIFEPYFSTKGTGNGLGLAICRNVVKKHGGDIQVSSSPKVTVFQVYLPAARKA